MPKELDRSDIDSIQKRVGLAHISELVTATVFETNMKQKCQVKLKI